MSEIENRATPNGTSYAGPVHFVSEPVTIGRHEWRVVVYGNPHFGICQTYEFRRDQTDRWQNEKRWPGYDINDTYSGLPRSLRLLHDRELKDLARFFAGAAQKLATITQEASRQTSLL